MHDCIKSCTDTIAVQISIVHEKDDLVRQARHVHATVF